MIETPYCCHIPCEQDAEWVVVFGTNPTPDDYTHACADHLGHLIGMYETPATVHLLQDEGLQA